ncbi:MAG: hypothetical protein IKL36_04810, partial [Clostridia bacterium]|nr:hypothetical protein [Clostridia bacterium]
SFSVFGSYQVTLKKGQTLWYCYDDASLISEGVFSQLFHASCSYNYTVTIDSTTYERDESGFINAKLLDEDKDGKYYFSVTNTSARKVSVFVSLEKEKLYDFGNVSLNIGDNEIEVNTEFPTIIYDFCPADVEAEAGLYKFTVKDMAGNIIEDALLGNWGSIGAPADQTGDAKTNIITWGTQEVNSTFLLGVSNVTENFIITVERLGDYDDGRQHIEYLDYTNVHTPSKFTMPAGTLSKLDITKKHILVLDTNGIYHLNSIDGPVVYVDLTNEAIDLKSAYGAYGANVLRVVYTNGSGEQCAYDMINSMKVYAESMDDDGYYPLTVDLEVFFKYYGEAQKWYNSEYSALPDIVSGTFIPESAWLATAYYLEENVGDSSDTTLDDTTNVEPGPDTTNPEDTDKDGVDSDSSVTDSESTKNPETNVGTDSSDNSGVSKDPVDSGDSENSNATETPGTSGGTQNSENSGSTGESQESGGTETPGVSGDNQNTDNSGTNGGTQNSDNNKNPESSENAGSNGGTNAPETTDRTDDIKIEESTDDTFKIAINAQPQFKTATELSYTFTFDPEKFEIIAIEGLDVTDYKLEEVENGKYTLTILNIAKVKSAVAGAELFKLVIKGKNGATAEELGDTSKGGISVKEAFKFESAPTGDSMVYVAIVAVAMIIGCAVVIAKKKKKF